MIHIRSRLQNNFVLNEICDNETCENKSTRISKAIALCWIVLFKIENENCVLAYPFRSTHRVFYWILSTGVYRRHVSNENDSFRFDPRYFTVSFSKPHETISNGAVSKQNRAKDKLTMHILFCATGIITLCFCGEKKKRPRYIYAIESRSASWYIECSPLSRSFIACYDRDLAIEFVVNIVAVGNRILIGWNCNVSSSSP